MPDTFIPCLLTSTYILLPSIFLHAWGFPGFGAPLLWPDALPGANPPLFPGLGTGSSVVCCTAHTEAETWLISLIDKAVPKLLNVKRTIVVECGVWKVKMGVSWPFLFLGDPWRLIHSCEFHHTVSHIPWYFLCQLYVVSAIGATEAKKSSNYRRHYCYSVCFCWPPCFQWVFSGNCSLIDLFVVEPKTSAQICGAILSQSDQGWQRPRSSCTLRTARCSSRPTGRHRRPRRLRANWHTFLGETRLRFALLE